MCKEPFKKKKTKPKFFQNHLFKFEIEIFCKINMTFVQFSAPLLNKTILKNKQTKNKTNLTEPKLLNISLLEVNFTWFYLFGRTLF